MANIISFPINNSKTNEDFFKDIQDFCNEYGAESIMVVAKAKEGDILTSYRHCNFGLMQEFCGHVQCDIIDMMIRANYE